MKQDLSDAIEIVLNAIAECQAQLRVGDLAKARVELTDPLFLRALEQVRFYKNELVE